MTANGKNVSVWTAGLCALVGASTLLAGCATDEADDTGLREGTYTVTGLELGSCANDTWFTANTTTTSLEIQAHDDAFVVSACTELGGSLACVASSPSRYAWSIDRWRGEDGGAFLAESGCRLLYIDATARLDGGELVIEAARWTSDVATGACTVDAVTAMREQPCEGRTRLRAVAQ